MKLGIGTRLNPRAVLLGIEVRDAQRAVEGSAGCIRLDVGGEAALLQVETLRVPLIVVAEVLMNFAAR